MAGISPNNSLDSLSDDELVQRAQVRTAEGRIPIAAWEAWVVLYERHKKRTLNNILHFLGDSHLYIVATDLTDSTFTKALDALPRKKPGPFRAWINAIARNETRRWFGEKATSLQAYIDWQEAHELPAESLSWVFLVGGKLEQQVDVEVRELIELAKNTLSHREYQIFVLYYEEGLELEEIASKLNARIASVRQTLWRATTRFKLFYEGPRPFPQPKKRKQPADGLPSSHKAAPSTDRASEKGGPET